MDTTTDQQYTTQSRSTVSQDTPPTDTTTTDQILPTPGGRRGRRRGRRVSQVRHTHLYGGLEVPFQFPFSFFQFPFPSKFEFQFPLLLPFPNVISFAYAFACLCLEPSSTGLNMLSYISWPLVSFQAFRVLACLLREIIIRVTSTLVI